MTCATWPPSQGLIGQTRLHTGGVCVLRYYAVIVTRRETVRTLGRTHRLAARRMGEVQFHLRYTARASHAGLHSCVRAPQ